MSSDGWELLVNCGLVNLRDLRSSFDINDVVGEEKLN
jgi:hypothetical protein